MQVSTYRSINVQPPRTTATHRACILDPASILPSTPASVIASVRGFRQPDSKSKPGRAGEAWLACNLNHVSQPPDRNLWNSETPSSLDIFYLFRLAGIHHPLTFFKPCSPSSPSPFCSHSPCSPSHSVHSTSHLPFLASSRASPTQTQSIRLCFSTAAPQFLPSVFPKGRSLIYSSGATNTTAPPLAFCFLAKNPIAPLEREAQPASQRHPPHPRLTEATTQAIPAGDVPPARHPRLHNRALLLTSPDPTMHLLTRETALRLMEATTQAIPGEDVSAARRPLLHNRAPPLTSPDPTMRLLIKATALRLMEAATQAIPAEDVSAARRPLLHNRALPLTSPDPTMHLLIKETALRLMEAATEAIPAEDVPAARRPRLHNQALPLTPPGPTMHPLPRETALHLIRADIAPSQRHQVLVHALEHVHRRLPAMV